MSKFVTYAGSHKYDIAALLGKLVDYEPGGMQGLRTDLTDFPEVVLDLALSVPVHGASSGVPQDVYAHFTECNDIVGQIDLALAEIEKMAEVLRESRAHYVDARQNDIAMIVDALRSRAQRRKDASLLAPFAKTIRYNGQIGVKAARTRRMNEAERNAELESTEPSETAQPTTVG